MPFVLQILTPQFCNYSCYFYQFIETQLDEAAIQSEHIHRKENIFICVFKNNLATCRHTSLYCALQVLCIPQHRGRPSASKKIMTHRKLR